MNKNYFNELNSRLSSANDRLAELNAEIYGPIPTAAAVKDVDQAPSLNHLAEAAMDQVNLIHDQISSLENSIKGK